MPEDAQELQSPTPRTQQVWSVSVEVATSQQALQLRAELKSRGLEPVVSAREVTAEEAVASGPSLARDTDLGRLVLDTMRTDPGRIWAAQSDFQDAFIARSYSKNSIAPTLSRLVREGDLEQVGKGLFILSPDHMADAMGGLEEADG